MACFDEDYDSAQPVHPGREFHGPDQVRRNWTALFREVPDVRAEVLAKTEDSGVEWAEWHWHGTRTDGSMFQMRGMTIGEPETAGSAGNGSTWKRSSRMPKRIELSTPALQIRTSLFEGVGLGL